MTSKKNDRGTRQTQEASRGVKRISIAPDRVGLGRSDVNYHFIASYLRHRRRRYRHRWVGLRRAALSDMIGEISPRFSDREMSRRGRNAG